MTKLVSLKSQVATNNKLTTMFICRVHKAKQDQEAHLDPGDFRQDIFSTGSESICYGVKMNKYYSNQKPKRMNNKDGSKTKRADSEYLKTKEKYSFSNKNGCEWMEKQKIFLKYYRSMEGA